MIGSEILFTTVQVIVQRLALGTKQSARENTKRFFAIYLHLDEIRDVEGFDNAYFTLPMPGIDRKYFEAMDETQNLHIQGELAAIYGQETIRYWGSAAQRRSVDFVSPVVQKRVRQRHNNRCVICTALAERYKQVNKPVPESLLADSNPTLCHIISRKSLFWQALHEIHQSLLLSNTSIFFDKGVQELRARLSMPTKSSPDVPTILARLHSSDEFIVYLCTRHDKIVQDAIRIDRGDRA